MQTSTHLAIGLAATAFFPHHPAAQVLCVIGAILPDAPMVLLFIIDKLRGRPPLVYQAPGWILAKNVCQSIVLWSFVFASAFVVKGEVRLGLLALGGNGVVHVVIDRYTHGSPAFNIYDGWYAWPFGAWARTGWDYRQKTGMLWPLKTEEAWVFYSCLLLATLGWLWVWLH